MAPQGAMHAIMKIWRMMYTHGGRARPMGASERRAAALLSLQHHAVAEAPAAGQGEAEEADECERNDEEDTDANLGRTLAMGGTGAIIPAGRRVITAPYA